MFNKIFSKKVSISLLFIFSISFSGSTICMFGLLKNYVCGLFYDTQEEKLAKESIARIKECNRAGRACDREDILTVAKCEKIEEGSKQDLEKAKEILKEKYKNIIEENMKKATKCCFCEAIFKEEFVYVGAVCPMCFSCCYCDKICMEKDLKYSDHSKKCPFLIEQEKKSFEEYKFLMKKIVSGFIEHLKVSVVDKRLEKENADLKELFSGRHKKRILEIERFGGNKREEVRLEVLRIIRKVLYVGKTAKGGMFPRFLSYILSKSSERTMLEMDSFARGISDKLSSFEKYELGKEWLEKAKKEAKEKFEGDDFGERLRKLVEQNKAEAAELAKKSICSCDKEKPMEKKEEEKPSVKEQSEKSQKEKVLENKGKKEEKIENKAEEKGFDFSPYCKARTEVDGVEFIQLNTVDQSVAYPKELAEKWEKSGRKKDIPQHTCARQAIRNSVLIHEFLQNNNNEKKSLEKINNEAHSKDELRKVLENEKDIDSKNQIGTSWLDGGEIEKIINKDFSKEKGFGDFCERVTVNYQTAEPAVHTEKFKPIVENFKKENYYHIFIINPGNHWYVMVLDKKGNRIRCLIMDTMKSNDHIKDSKYLGKNKPLCDYFLGITSEEELKKIFEGLGLLSKNSVKTGSGETVKSAVLDADEDGNALDNEADEIEKAGNKIEENGIETADLLKKFSKMNESKNNIYYFCLNTVSHLNPKVLCPVTERFDTIRMDYQIATMKEPEEKQPKSYYPFATSGSQAIRNARIINDFFVEKDAKLKKGCIEKLSDIDDAAGYLENLISKKLATSYLSEKNIESNLSFYDNLSDKVMVLDSFIEIKTNKEKGGQIEKIIESFENKENYYHIFILNIADFAYSDASIKFVKNFETDSHCKLDEESCREFFGKNKWFIVALEKCKNIKRCFIIDTEPDEKEIKESQKYFACNCLAEYVLQKNRNKLCDYEIKTCEKFYSEFRSAIESKTLKNDLKFDERFLIKQDNEILPESLENSVYNSCSEQVKSLIDSYNLAIELSESDKNEDTKGEHFERLPRIIVLYGPNGTGKSVTAKIFAQKINSKLFFINCGLLGTKYQYSIQESLKREIYPAIKLSKAGERCVIVLDEVDALTEKNSHSESADRSKEAAIGSLLDICDKYGIIVVCTTNYLGDLTSKIISRARSSIIKVSFPSDTCRKDILKYFLIKQAKDSKRIERKDLAFESIDLDFISKNTQDFSIRHLDAIVEGAFDNAIKRANRAKSNKVIICQDDILEQVKIITATKKEIEESRAGKDKKAFGKSSWEATRSTFLMPILKDIISSAIKLVVAEPKLSIRRAVAVTMGVQIPWCCAEFLFNLGKVLISRKDLIEKTQNEVIALSKNLSKSVRRIRSVDKEIKKSL